MAVVVFNADDHQAQTAWQTLVLLVIFWLHSYASPFSTHGGPPVRASSTDSFKSLSSSSPHSSGNSAESALVDFLTYLSANRVESVALAQLLLISVLRGNVVEVDSVGDTALIYLLILPFSLAVICWIIFSLLHRVKTFVSTRSQAAASLKEDYRVNSGLELQSLGDPSINEELTINPLAAQPPVVD